MRKELLLSGAALVVLVLIGACTAHGPIVAGSSPSASTTPSDSASSGSSQSPSAAASASPTPTATPVQAGPGTWQPGPEMSSPRTDFAAVALPRGGVLLIGGESTFTTITASADIFDPTTNTIHPAAPMSTARSGHEPAASAPCRSPHGQRQGVRNGGRGWAGKFHSQCVGDLRPGYQHVDVGPNFLRLPAQWHDRNRP